jgi:hypothetical protein
VLAQAHHRHVGEVRGRQRVRREGNWGPYD